MRTDKEVKEKIKSLYTQKSTALRKGSDTSYILACRMIAFAKWFLGEEKSTRSKWKRGEINGKI